MRIAGLMSCARLVGRPATAWAGGQEWRNPPIIRLSPAAILASHVARHRGGAGRAPRGWPRRLAAVRLPGREPGRGPPDRRRGLGPHGHPALVLPRSRAKARRPGSSTPSSATTWTAFRARRSSTPGATRLTKGLETLLAGRRRLAMEYSKDCAIPYLSRVDAGTIELVRSHGVEVVSSGDLVQRFEAVWDDAALATHQDASVRLYRIKDRALAFVRAALAAGRALTEFDVQQEMVQAFRDEDLSSDSAPVVGAQDNAGNPHYLPTAAAAPRHRPRRSAAPRSVGQAADAGRGLRRHHLDGVHRRRRFRTASRPRGRPPPGRATPRSRSSRTASPPAAPSAASRSTRRRGRC